MKTKTIRSSRLALTLSPLALLAAGSTFGACTAEFELDCPEGQEQVAGGGDVNKACQPKGQQGEGGAAGSGGPQGGSAGAGSGGAAGGGSGGGLLPIPDGGVCQPRDTKCGDDTQQTCNDKGQWGEPAACDIACDGAGKACVVPVQLAAGREHFCARLSDGTVRCWGSDSRGQLGNEQADSDSSIPVTVQSLQSVDAIASSPSDASCALLKDKTVVCWGDSGINNPGSTQPDVELPTPSGGASNVLLVAVGADHICALKADGTVQCKSDNEYGQLGIGSLVNSSVFAGVAPNSFSSPVQKLTAGDHYNCALLENGTVSCWGRAGGNGTVNVDRQIPTLLNGIAGIQNIFGGPDSACAIRNDKTLVCWGVNQNGELGRGTTTSATAANPDANATPDSVSNLGSVIAAAVGRQHTCAAKQDGTLWCWGRNEKSELANTCDAIGCISEPSLHVNVPVKVPVLSTVVEVAAGSSTTCARQTDNRVYCWGANDKGQVGNGVRSTSVTTPTPVVWK